MKQGDCRLCAEVRFHKDHEFVSIVNLALHPTKPFRKLPPRTLVGRLQRAWLALTGWELYGR